MALGTVTVGDKSACLFSRAKKSHIAGDMPEISPGFIARAVRQARTDAGLTQAGLAEASGLRRETIYRLERGRGVHADTLARIATTLGLPRERFLEQGDILARLFYHPKRTPIRDRRRELGLTLSECAKAAGVSVTTLSRFERGNEHYPSICVVGRVFRATAIHNEDLASILGFPDAEALTTFWLERR